MKLYRTSHSADYHVHHWDGTQADAAKRRKELKTNGCRDIETKEIDVPTDKQGLLAWLNENCTGVPGVGE